MEQKFQNYCDRLNSALQIVDKESMKNALNAIIAEMYNEFEDSNLYFSRDTYIANKFDGNEIKKDLLNHPADYTFEVSDDLDEHPGVVINFK